MRIKIIEQSILIFLIVLNVLEFLGFVHGDIKFIKAVVSMTAVAYVLIQASPSSILRGKKNYIFDVLLIIACFFLVSNKITQIIELSFEDAFLFHDLFRIVLMHRGLLEGIAFYVGTFGLIMLSVYMTAKSVYQPSLLSSLHGKGLLKPLLSFFFITSFYVIIFNVVMEWLTLVLDSFIIVLAIFIYLLKHHVTVDRDMLLHKVADAVETFLERFMSLFQHRSTLLIGLSLLLALHLITDLVGFIFPYVLNTESIYLLEGPGHEPIFHLINMGSFSSMVIEGVAYLFNTFAVVMMMLMPMYVIYTIYYNIPLKYSRHMLALFYCSLSYVVVSPVYVLGSFTRGLLGVDIQTQAVTLPGMGFIAALLVFFMVSVLTYVPLLKRMLFDMIIVINGVFVAYYVFLYVQSIVHIYGQSIAFAHSLPVLESLYLILFQYLFAGVSVLFYAVGLAGFVNIIYQRLRSMS